MASLTVTNLTIEYDRTDYVVRPIEALNFAAKDGEIVILQGPSGSGKTTLLSCIAGILTPAQGTITVGTTVVTSLRGVTLAQFRRFGVGVVFQAFNLIPSMSARQNVEVPLRLAGQPRAVARARAQELLSSVGLAERTHHLPNALSGGQRQRVAIARALSLNPPLIVADEPTAHLDYVQVEGVLRLLRDLACPGRLIVVATHDERLMPLADRLIELSPRSTENHQSSFEVLLEPGQMLFEQGDSSDFVYVVRSGQIELFRRTPMGGQTAVSSCAPGSYFGEMGPMLHLPRSASARAQTAATVMALSVADFRRWQSTGRSQDVPSSPT